MENVINNLFQLQDLKYRDFHSKLMPTIDKEKIIGVRTPALRNFAKQFANSPEVEVFMNELPHYYYEENNLHGFLIEKVSRDFDDAMSRLESFLPYVDNWATCDMLAPKKQFKKNPEKLYSKTLKWLESSHVYTVRFAIVTQLGFFLDEEFNPEMLTILSQIHSDEYYINMAIAWYYSFALIKQYDSTIGMFENPVLDKWVHNKSIQKAVESYRIDTDTKVYLRSLKIK